MFKKNKTWKCLWISYLLLLTLLLTNFTLAHAQYWEAMPPYNLLWPLWSPALSPVNATTGLPTPLVNSLSNLTVLPAQPALVWNPNHANPWLVYNIPALLGGGLTFFDPFYGLLPFPPSSLIDPTTGAPLPITLPVGYELLPPTDINSFGLLLHPGNTSYAIQYPSFLFGFPFSSLLTANQIWGLPPL